LFVWYIYDIYGKKKMMRMRMMRRFFFVCLLFVWKIMDMMIENLHESSYAYFVTVLCYTNDDDNDNVITMIRILFDWSKKFHVVT